jgi:hypothetical protein
MGSGGGLVFESSSPNLRMREGFQESHRAEKEGTGWLEGERQERDVSVGISSTMLSGRK